MVSLLDSSRRRSKIAGKTDEIRDIWNDNAARIVGPSVPGMLEKLEGCMTDVLALLREVKEAVSTGQVVDQCSARKEGRRSCRRAEGNGGITREGVAGRELSSGRVDG